MSKSTKIIAALGVAAGLGVSALPMSSYAVQGNVNLQVTVDDAIAMTITSTSDEGKYEEDFMPSNLTEIDGFTTGNATLAKNASSVKINMLPNTVNEDTKSTITVYTNHSTGYTLGISSVEDLKTADGAYSIPANTSVAAGTSAWAYKVNDGAYAAADDAAIATSSEKTNGGAQTVVKYGFSTSADQATGVYTDTITYTATCNQ